MTTRRDNRPQRLWPDAQAGGRAPRPPRRPLSTAPNPIAAPAPGGTSNVEFTPLDVAAIRHTFHATQSQFARMFGISVETLRNWEQGRRKPRGPARALLRVAKARPHAVAQTLWRFRRVWWMDHAPGPR